MKPCDKTTSAAVDDTINTYFTKTPFSMPLTGFDLFMTNQIKEAYKGLLNEFEALSEKEKQQFAEYYAPFLTLAQKLEEEEETIRNKARFDSFKQHHSFVHTSSVFRDSGEVKLLDYLLIEIRKLAIRLFGEESLDDFSYREFMAFGLKSTKPLFATRKLLSPLKWIAAIIGALDILTRGTADYYFLGRYSLPFYTLTAPVYAAHVVIELLASPINQISRPLSELTGLPPAVFTSLIAAISSSVLYELITGAMSLSLSSAMLFLPYVNLALSIYSIYSALEMLAAGRWDWSETETIMFFLYPTISIIDFMRTGYELLDFMLLIGNLCVLNRKAEMSSTNMDDYPLAREAISEELREATLLGYKTAHQSHRFFNTPKEAECTNHPSFLQKTGRFFGFNSTVHHDLKPWCTDAPAMTPTA